MRFKRKAVKEQRAVFSVDDPTRQVRSRRARKPALGANPTVSVREVLWLARP